MTALTTSCLVLMISPLTFFVILFPFFTIRMPSPIVFLCCTAVLRVAQSLRNSFNRAPKPDGGGGGSGTARIFKNNKF